MRVAILGSSGSGKSTLARRVAERTGWRHVELDALYHLADWQPQDRDVLRSQVGHMIANEHWVCDGNYNALVGDLIQSAADTIVVFDLPRLTVLRQIAWRTLRRAIRREELWNGNREPLSNLVRWEPEENVIRWSWVHHDRRHHEYRARAATGVWDHAEVIWVEDHSAAERWLSTLPRAGSVR